MINQAAHDGSSRSDTSEWVAGIKKTGKDVRLYVCFLAHPASFLFRVSLQHPLVSSLVSGETIHFSGLSRVASKSEAGLGPNRK